MLSECSKWLAARCQYAHARRVLKEGFGDTCDLIDHVLAAIEHNQQFPGSDELHDA